jgi:N-acetylneuraminic acid mutarotase
MKGGSSKRLSTVRAATRALYLVAAALALAGCGKGSSSGSSSSYTIGGTITGLTTGSVVLVNGSTTVTVAADASTWVFAGAFAAGTSYAVTVLTQPAGVLCEVTGGGTGATLTADVNNVTVACSPFGQWVWQAGLNTINASGVYGTQGVTATSNLPGARYSASSWTDSSGNFWLFGGVGYDSTGTAGDLNDLWQYSPSTGQWTWISGASAVNAAGVYGVQGTASASNVPGARYAASYWIDTSGNLWLFGGVGYDSTGTAADLNDLWRYSPSTRQWTWISGANAVNTAGVYGTQGSASAGNAPGARAAASAWIDSSGNLWLLGGYGYDSTGQAGNLNDLWRYSPSTGVWAWIAGASAVNAIGVYGTQGTASADNIPGARQAASSWIDSSGNLWLFGGYGDDATANLGYLNDLWQYSPSSGQWTWIGGATAVNANGVYGTHGSASASNTPGARQAASSWIDSSGNLWLLGGAGYDSAANLGELNDLWEYSLTSGQWTWVDGSNTPNAPSEYGFQGSISATAAPGARYSASSWIDASGHLWLFGGAGYGTTNNGYLNDLWEFSPP